MSVEQEDRYEEELIQRLAQLRQAPARDPQKAAAGRSRYLSETKALINETSTLVAVSVTPLARLNEWIRSMNTQMMRKERYSMISLITALVVAVTLVFGGAGVTAYAAQDSLPNDLLYPVKTLTEDLQMELTTDPQAKVELAMKLADRRVTEILALTAEGTPLPAGLAISLQEAIDLALTTAASMDDAAMLESLEYVGVHIQKHDRDMIQGRTGVPEGVDPVEAQVRAMLQIQIGLTDTGLTDPTAFRLRMNQPITDPLPTEVVTVDPLLVTDVITPVETITATGQITTPVYSGFGPGPGPGPANQGELTHPTEPYGPGPGPHGTPAAGTVGAGTPKKTQEPSSARP